MADPIAENLRILFIADDYAYDGKPGYTDKYVNLSKLLRSSSIFTLDLPGEESSLTEDELIRVKPFEFRWYSVKYSYNFDDEPRNIIYWAPSIRDAKTIEDQYIKSIESFDIVFYIRSSNKNELMTQGKTLEQFATDGNKVLIQTPSSGKFTAFNEKYEDPILKQEVRRSSYFFSNQRAIELKSTNSETILKEPYNLIDKKVGFPYKDKEPFNVTRIIYRDFQFLGKKNWEGTVYDVLSRINVVTDINIFTDHPPAILYRSNIGGNHLWLGSSYIFIDKAMNVEGIEAKPATKEGFLVAGGLLPNIEDLGVFNPFPESSAKIDNSKFFVNIMNWAIKSCGKSKNK